MSNKATQAQQPIDLHCNSFYDCVLYARPYRSVEKGNEKIDCELVLDNKGQRFVFTLPECADYSPHQSLIVAHTGSTTGSNHNLDAPVVCKVSSNAYDHAGQIKGPGVRNQVVPGQSCNAPGALKGAIQGGWRACMPPTLLCTVLLSYSPPWPEGNLVAKAKQGGAVLLGNDVAKWLSGDVGRVVLALDVLGLDGAGGDQLADLELAAVDVL
eukprot:6195350-Pleurochrysis_carterae.AAC.3